MATLKDIAGLANVSITTVSRVLKNDHEISVTPETRKRIFDVANELGYKVKKRKEKEVPAQAEEKVIRVGIAQMFEKERVLEDIYYLMLKSALEEACFSKNIDTVTLFRNEDGEFVMHEDAKLDGIFGIGCFTTKEIESFKRYTKNLVFVDSSPDEETYFSIVPNVHLGMNQVIAEFSKKGHEKIGYVGSKLIYQKSKYLILDSRLYYFRNILNDRGRYQEEWVIDCEMNSKSSYEQLLLFLKNKDQSEWPSAFFVSSDVMIPGVMKALREMKVRVPEDISLVTYNDTKLSELSDPPITSVHILIPEFAKAAVQFFMEQLEGSMYPKKLVIPCSLNCRASVKEIK
ncbi:MAG: LacI family DNA-binding transcriptional regulator [bacterium]|nr:LacI family DNA-binding transcriptional regulator [bacterium]